MIRSLIYSCFWYDTLENKQNTITNNMANANTIGYKSENLAIKSFDDVIIQNKDKIAAGKKCSAKIRINKFRSRN